MHQLDVRTTTYFSGGIMFLGVSMVLPGIFIVSKNLLASLPFFLISLITVTTHYRIALDVSQKKYRQYVWLLGSKWGEWESFDKIEYLFIKKNKMVQTMHSMLNYQHVHSYVYDGFLKFSEKDKAHIASASNKDALLKKLQVIAVPLQLDILDYSQEKGAA